MDIFTELLSSGIALGMLYALVALGFVIIYRASQVFNFAQGEFVTVGAFIMASLADILPWPIALIITLIATGLLAAVLERLILRRLIGRPVYVSIILTIIIGYLLRTLVILFWGPYPRGMPTPWETTGAISLGNISIFYNSLGAIAAGLLTLAGFYLLLHRSRIGLGMRASSVDQEASLTLGIPVGRILAFTWFLAGASAALAGVFLGMFPQSVDAGIGYVALRAFPAVIVGGLDSVLGTVIAGLLLGILEVMSQGYLNPLLGQFGQNFHAVFPYIVMILFLIFRPYGLFGRKTVERV